MDYNRYRTTIFQRLFPDVWNDEFKRRTRGGTYIYIYRGKGRNFQKYFKYVFHLFILKLNNIVNHSVDRGT